MDIDEMVERYWDNRWEEMNADTPFDKASDRDIWDFILRFMDEEYEEEFEEWCGDLNLTVSEGEHLRDAFDANYLRDNEDRIAEKYNDWAEEQRRTLG